MKKYLQLLIALSVMLASSVYAKDASLSMAYTNALGDELPFAIFAKHSWSPASKARYVKLHLYFDDPIMVQGLEIDTCGSRIDPPISLFFNFDQWVLHADSSLSGEVPRASYLKVRGDMLILEGFKKSVEVRSLTFNFESNTGFRICGIHIKDPQGETYNIKTPTLVTGSVKASSILDPQTAYDPIFLFDSRFEYGWASNKQAKDVNLSFNFDQPQRVEEIRIWNGYQRSVNHCQANSRAKLVKLTGDDGYNEVITIRDVLGAQVISLPKPFTGKQLKFEIVDSFLGKSYKDLVISELRFFDGKDWFMLDPTHTLQESIAVNRALFAQANAATLLNESFVGEHNFEESGVGYSNRAVLRLRADGSFYISGSSSVEGSGNDYFALGNYEIKSVDAKKGLRLRLFGLYYQSEEYGDCNGCGRDCNKNVETSDGSIQKIFQEFVTIKPAEQGKFMLTNESGGKKLPFDKFLLNKTAP